MSVAVVRDEHGAILGIDFRQSPLADPSVKVPGRIPVHAVMPGDRVQMDGQAVTVLRIRGGAVPADRVHIITRTDDGAEVVFERAPHVQVDVVAVGVFDR